MKSPRDLRNAILERKRRYEAKGKGKGRKGGQSQNRPPNTQQFSYPQNQDPFWAWNSAQMNYYAQNHVVQQQPRWQPMQRPLALPASAASRATQLALPAPQPAGVPLAEPAQPTAPQPTAPDQTLFEQQAFIVPERVPVQQISVQQPPSFHAVPTNYTLTNMHEDRLLVRNTKVSHAARAAADARMQAFLAANPYSE